MCCEGKNPSHKPTGFICNSFQKEISIMIEMWLDQLVVDRNVFAAYKSVTSMVNRGLKFGLLVDSSENIAC